MAIDVVIPLFDGGAWIDETLRGVLAQSAPIGRVLVVDDGSTDDGPDRVRAYGDRVELTPSLAKRHARRTGFLAVESPLVAFLDQDDVWHPDHLARLADALEAIPEAPAAAATTSSFRERERPVHVIRRGGAQRFDPWASWPFACPIISPSAVLFRSDALASAGGWTPEPAPDWSLYLRLGRAAPLARIPSSTCAYRLHRTSHSTALQKDGLSLLDRLSSAVHASYEERSAIGIEPGVGERLARRHKAFVALEAFLRAAHGEDATAAFDAARRLEECLAEGAAHGREVRGFATYLFCPNGDPDEHRTRRAALFARLAPFLPSSLPHLNDAFVAGAHRRPFRWRRFVRHALKGRWRAAHDLWRQRRDDVRAATD